ncbi:uncharacterized protein PAN0_001d0147 [Moesziomyces antarcticus]|uniref:Uncharacterized protein n=1 Tax=Pseudozyma antarctica TaxID=84753 RepID=A0A5C3FDH8_PSEA2|nr:uncharacterized protein PAN0_001d0147 [Moesziomyces antarcticus]GAK61952.1 conserved hypothetical protein [Moesziomyces antarcticus]SPO42472.1 uncharacterized protein PSANT_00155 [Moesziomyces antarcticus]
MPSSMRRPPPDRRSIVNSMGLPPRDPVAEPTSPTYYPTFPRSRRDSNASGARRSERSFGARRADESDHQYDDRSRRSAPRHYDDDRRRQDSRRADRDDGRRRFDSLPAAPRSHTNSTRRPALPDFDDDRDRDVLDDLDEEDADQLDADDARSNRRRSINPPRRSMALSDRPAVVRKPVPKKAERDHDDEDDNDDKADFDRRRRSVSNPYGAPEPYEEYSNARYVERAPARSVSNGNMSRDYRRKSTSARPTKPSSYNSRDARRDDLERSADRDSRRSDSARNGGGLLSRVLSRTSGSSRGDLNASRMERSSSRLNRYSERQPGADRRDESEIELARIEEEEMLLAMKKRRSAANRATNGYDQDDPRWYRDDRDLRHPVNRSRVTNTHSAGLERSASGVRRSMDRERHRTLATLERNNRQDGELPTVSRTDAVARARSQSHSTSQPQSRSRALSASRSAAPPQRASREAALAAITGVSTGAAAASVGRSKSQQAAQEDDQDSESEVSSVDDDLLHDAPEPADVHDDEAVPVIVAKPVLNGSKAAVPAAVASASKKVPETTSDDEQDSDEDSDEDSTEQTSDEPPVAKAAPAISAAMVRKPSTASKSSSQIVATSAAGRAAPKGYMNFTRKSPAAPAAAPATKPVASKARAHSESEASSQDSEEEEVEETPKPSRATPAAAIAALSGGVVAGAGLLSSKRSSQADKDQRRAAKLQAEQEQKAAEAQARAEKAERSAERRKAKQEASAAAAAAALAAKEAKRSEKIKMKEARQAELERKRDEESQARDRAIREREEAEEKRLLAIREKEREREDKAEARRQSRRRPHGAGGPKMRDAGVKPLTPQQRHHLLKALVMLQMQSEWAEVEKLGALTEYGYPFSSQRSKLTRVKTFERGEDAGEYSGAARDPYANDDAMREGENLQEPLLLRHLFHVHLHSFPGLDLAPEKYWQKRIQPFFDEMAARNFSTSIERGEISKRRLYALAATRYLGSFVSRGFGVRGEGETRGPGLGDPGTEKWGVGKNWGKGTVKRGLDRPERIDAELMQNIDNLFDGEGGRVWRAAGKEWAKVRGDWCAFKESIIESETGLEDAISYLDISSIKNLPPHYRNSVEFARIHAAYIFYTLFVSAPNADDLFKMVRGIHALAPYWGAKQLLKYANAETMISGILSLLLARPGGAKSLIQRVFSYVIGKEAAYIQKEFVVPLRKEIDDPELTKKIEDYVRRGDRVESRRVQREAKKRGEDVLTTILLTAGGKLGGEAENHVLELQRCFALSPYRGNLSLAYPETTPAGADRPPMPAWGAQGAEHTRARKFALLKLLLRESLKRRDREQAVELASGSLIPAIIKDSLETVFYPAIREIAGSANLSERLGDLQKFIDDMLETKKKGGNSIEDWIALAARHEQSLYVLFHECAPIAKPLWDWCQLGLDYMALSTTDPAHPADRRAANLEINFEELLQDSRLSDADVKKIVGEAERLARYSKWMKVRYELEARKNYLLAKPEAAHPGGVSERDLTDETMRREVKDIDAMMRDLMEEAGETFDDGVCEDGVRGTEKYDFPWAFFDEVDPLNQHLAAEEEAGELRVPKVAVGFPPPSLKHIRKLQPLFCELLASKLPEWQSEDVLGQLQSDVGGSKARKGKPSLSLKPRKANTSFSESASMAPAYPAENRSMLSTATSRFGRLRVPSLFGRK